MRRKIIPHGPSSLTVSLPSAWVKQHNLKKGGEIDVYEDENSLMIRPVSMNSATKKVEISFAGVDSAIWKDVMLALHKKGYDEIKIGIDSQDTIKELHAYLSSMQLGFEIIKQDADCVLVRNITNPESEEFDTLFRRVFWITHEYTIKLGAIMSDSEDITHSCLLHENSIGRITNYCKRIIVKEKRTDSCFLYSILDDLNALAHSLTDLLAGLKAGDEPVPKGFIAKFLATGDLLSEIYELYYKFSISDYGEAKGRLECIGRQIIQIKSRDKTGLPYWDYLDSITKNAHSILESILVVHY
jgi:hypothetical protein